MLNPVHLQLRNDAVPAGNHQDLSNTLDQDYRAARYFRAPLPTTHACAEPAFQGHT